MSMIAAFFSSTAKAAGQTFLLDQFGDNIRIAYSVRKLSSTYSGAAMRVRESSGNTEADIGFDSNGGLDEKAKLDDTENIIDFLKYLQRKRNKELN